MHYQRLLPRYGISNRTLIDPCYHSTTLGTLQLLFVWLVALHSVHHTFQADSEQYLPLPVYLLQILTDSTKSYRELE